MLLAPLRVGPSANELAWGSRLAQVLLVELVAAVGILHAIMDEINR